MDTSLHSRNVLCGNSLFPGLLTDCLSSLDDDVMLHIGAIVDDKHDDEDEVGMGEELVVSEGRERNVMGR